MKTKMKKASKPMMRKGSKVLPKHQTPPGQTEAPYKKLSMVASDDEKFVNKFGQGEQAEVLRRALARERAAIDKRNSNVPYKVQEANKTLQTQKKGGTAPKGKPMMKKTSKKK